MHQRDRAIRIHGDVVGRSGVRSGAAEGDGVERDASGNGGGGETEGRGASGGGFEYDSDGDNVDACVAAAAAKWCDEGDSQS